MSIDDLSRTMECAVCGRDEPAPVSGDWHFRANPFLIEAYREHGTEAVIWALWRLWDRSRRSFYFAPSLKLCLAHPDGSSTHADAEVDAVVVVDGRVYLIEAKGSGGLDDGEIAQLVLAAERIRPDVLLLACMDEPNRYLDSAAEKLQRTLPAGVSVEVITFTPGQLDRSPFLPS